MRMIEQEEKTTEMSGRNPRRAALAIAAVCALAAAGAFGLIVRAQLPAGANAVSATPKTQRVLITIEGMHCGSCASGIRSMLKRTPGVVSAEVSFEQKEANVEFDPSAISREKIVEAINNMGYKASLKS